MRILNLQGMLVGLGNARTMLIILVLYLNPWREALRSSGLLEVLSRCPQSGLSLEHVLIYDNSPQPQDFTGQERCTYVYDNSNGGTRAAFLHGYKLAKQLGCKWMLFLDQDTVIPSSYWPWLLGLTASKLSGISVVIPAIESNGVVVSPRRMDAFGRLQPSKPFRQVSLLIPSWTSAIASGLMIRVSSFGSLGPIPDVFWLDCLDHWIFFRCKQLRLGILESPVCFSHDLAFSFPARMPLHRLRNIIRAEAAFAAYLPLAARIYWPLRLIKYRFHMLSSLLLAGYDSSLILISRCIRKITYYPKA